jgi:hypothetical protein
VQESVGAMGGPGICRAGNPFSHFGSGYKPEPAGRKLLHTIPETPIDFMPNLNMVLLGVNSFLSNLF